MRQKLQPPPGSPFARAAERALTRRHFLEQAGMGLGATALATLLGESAIGQTIGAVGAHHAPRAKSVIFLFMAGAPSQLDLFDYKPKLAELDGQPVPGELIQGERFAFIAGDPRLLGSPHQFSRRGASGAWVSELLPATAGVVDDLAIVRSMHTDQFNHAPAQVFMNCGHQLVGRPSMGSWAIYGLGSENRDLPGFVVLLSGVGQPDGGKSCWSSGFLPTQYQGVEFRSQGDPVLSVSNPPGMDAGLRRRSLDALKDLNEIQLGRLGDPEISTRIAAYELAFRMQTSVPELTDLSNEPQSVREMYGTEPGKASFANNCLLARRLVERGVRFVQLYHRGWDSHGTGSGDDIVHSLPLRCRETDNACAALIRDLKQRGLLESTLVVWGGEFGRTPMNERRNGSTFLGRDHHPRAFTMWLAGGGIRPGTVLGATDPFGYNITDDPVHVHDLHATILHLMGIEHTRLTYRFQGREFRLTDVAGKLVTKLLA
jgi:hypothetical protein